MRVGCRHLNWQVASLAQISDALRTVLSAVEHLTLEYWRSSISSEWHHEADRSQWRELLRPFSKVKILVVPTGLVGELSLSLQLDNGESPMMLLPELKELFYPASDDTNDPFASFLDARRNAGHPVVVPPPYLVWRWLGTVVFVAITVACLHVGFMCSCLCVWWLCNVLYVPHFPVGRLFVIISILVCLRYGDILVYV